MTLLTYESSAVVTPRWSLLALFGCGAGLLNANLVIIALYGISQIEDPDARRLYSVSLLLETAPIVLIGVWAVANVIKSRGKLRGLLAAIIGSFFASTSGLLVAVAGAAFTAQSLLPNC